MTRRRLSVLLAVAVVAVAGLAVVLISNHRTCQDTADPAQVAGWMWEQADQSVDMSRLSVTFHQTQQPACAPVVLVQQIFVTTEAGGTYTYKEIDGTSAVYDGRQPVTVTPPGGLPQVTNCQGIVMMVMVEKPVRPAEWPVAFATSGDTQWKDWAYGAVRRRAAYAVQGPLTLKGC